jgi:hypothetical protein
MDGYRALVEGKRRMGVERDSIGRRKRNTRSKRNIFSLMAYNFL